MSSNKYKELFDKAELDPSVKESLKDKIYTLKFDFEVGNEEKHNVEFIFDIFFGYAAIKIDGRVVKKKLFISAIPESRTFECTVGEKEKHNVRIVLVRAHLPVGYRECTAWAYVDEKLKGQYDGELYPKLKKYRDMSHKGRMTFISVVAFLLVLLSIAVIYHIPIDVDEELNGMVFRAGTTEPDYMQPIRITVKGRYYRNLFLRNPYRFEGSVRVYAREEGKAAISKADDSVNRINIGVPIIRGYMDSVRSFTYSTHDGGLFYMKPDASAFMIVVSERDASGERVPAGGTDGIYYAAPCNTREEAVDIINEIRLLVLGKKTPPVE